MNSVFHRLKCPILALVGLLWAIAPALAQQGYEYGEAEAGPGPGMAFQQAPESYSLGETTWEAPPEVEPEAEVVDDGYRSEIDRAWFGAGAGLNARAAAARVRAMQVGQTNLDSAARAMLVQTDPGEALGNAILAVRLAPDLPIAHMALARAHWADGSYADAIGEAMAGIAAIPRNLEASIWLLGSLLVMIATVLVIGSLVFIWFVGMSVISRASHDLGDLFSKKMPGYARLALIGSLLLIPLALGEGMIGLTLGFFGLGVTFGDTRHRMALCLAVTMFMLGLHPVSQLAMTALRGLDADRLASAALSVLSGEETAADVALIEAASGHDVLARQMLALRARRSGHLREATERYEALLAASPRDAVVLNNYANLRFNRGETEAAVELYERAAALEDRAPLMFNLSQAYARLFRIEQFEGALRSAQALDVGAVAELSRIEDANFVVDLAYNTEPIHKRLYEAARSAAAPQAAIESLLPGWLGRSGLHTIVAFLVVALISLGISTRFDHASSCTRCGRRICGRCDGTFWNSETCDGCYHIFFRPETTDPNLRMARLVELQSRDVQRGRVISVLSLLLPGVGGLFARRPDLGFLGTLLFGLAAVLLIWRDGVVPDPIAVGSAGTLAFIVAGCLAATAYLVVVGSGLVIRRNL